MKLEIVDLRICLDAYSMVQKKFASWSRDVMIGS